MDTTFTRTKYRVTSCGYVHSQIEREVGRWLKSWVCYGLLLTAVFSDACFGFAQEARIRVGYSAMSDSMAWVWAAKEGGY